MFIEICATSYNAAFNAQKAGAHRIELCSELAVGGITPSFGLIEMIKEKLDIPVKVLIRPRSGNFVYSPEEFETMLRDIKKVKEVGCKGIVSGVLTSDFEIDREKTKELIDAAFPLDFTFHRAFDLTPNLFESLKVLKKLKVSRILTSGQAESAEKGLEVLIELKELAGKELIILPGGGISPSNIYLFKKHGFHEIHASASKVQSVSIEPKISMNSPKFLDETKIYSSDYEMIRQLLNS